MTRLPDKPSQLIRVALADLEKVERDARYVVQMGCWHATYLAPGKCAVCLAGAVMAGALGADPAANLDPVDFGEDTEEKLEALDEFRHSTREGLSMLALVLPLGVPDREPPSYYEDPEGFKSTLRQIADDLEGAGL